MTTSGPNDPNTGGPVPPAGDAMVPDYSAVPAGGYAGPAPDEDSKTMAMLAHLLGILGFLGPLIIWLIKKDQSPFVNDQGKEALNFHLTLLIGIIVGIATACLGVGFVIIAL